MKRNEELESKFSGVAKSNFELQRTERELRDKLITSLPKEDFETLNAKVKVSKKSVQGFKNKFRLFSNFCFTNLSDNCIEPNKPNKIMKNV